MDGTIILQGKLHKEMNTEEKDELYNKVILRNLQILIEHKTILGGYEIDYMGHSGEKYELVCTFGGTNTLIFKKGSIDIDNLPDISHSLLEGEIDIVEEYINNAI